MINFIPELKARGNPSAIMNFLVPLIAVALTVITGSIIFALMGFDPFFALHTFFISPISNSYGISELLVKATPLALIGVGLAFCFKNNLYNIGAEGQLTMGAVFGGGIGLLFYDTSGFWILPLMILGGAVGGALWGLIPAVLKVRFNTNEILTSLMLVYIAILILDYLVVGPWKDPQGYSFPKTRKFGDSGRMPLLFSGLRVHFGIIITLIGVFASWFIFSKTMLGYQLKVTGYSPIAARYAGFNQNRLIYTAFIFSGAFAGIAGRADVEHAVISLLLFLSVFVPTRGSRLCKRSTERAGCPCPCCTCIERPFPRKPGAGADAGAGDGLHPDGLRALPGLGTTTATTAAFVVATLATERPPCHSRHQVLLHV